ncbi:MAG: hydantoinase/oxoprolinase family protein [Anaerolineae bacterium]|nr:hydantoinase/oxoprolinase family protein [Anaerolineae bacterium]
MDARRFLLAVDIGGTFTDLVLLDTATNAIAVGKVLTSYPDPSEAVLTGVRQLLAEQQIAPQRIQRVIHGTTLVTNTLIERKGAQTALLTTEGFRDALEIGNEGRYDIYDLGLIKPDPLVERRLRIGIRERLTADGEVHTPLDEAALTAACDSLKREQIAAIAICFLHTYMNPAHEMRAAELVRAALPGVSISLSHQVSPAMREYQRTSTTVANAYVQPIAARYLENLKRGLNAADLDAPLNIMLSSGGTTTVETAADFPVRLVESGPSGGALAGVYWGKLLGYDDIFAFDMGGTTAKAVLTRDGALTISSEAEVAHVHRFKRGSGLPLLVPMIQMIEIGAGGGSIAHLNAMGLPAVGPESAGSTPGPVCYARGGTQPTVTDADLVLGYLNPAYFANGTIPLDAAAARASFAPLAGALAVTPEKVAWGIQQLVYENMAAAARVHAAERGLNIRRYALVATGGAGPVHACGVAERLHVDTVIVPPIAGVGSAFGFLLAPISFDFTRSYLTRLDALDLDRLNRVLDTLESDGMKIVTQAGVPRDQIQVTRSVDMRYLGQGYEIRVPFDAGVVDDAMLAQIQRNFEAEYAHFYGRLCDGVPVQAVNWRVVISGPRLAFDQLLTPRSGALATPDQPYASRPLIFDAVAPAVMTPVYRREQLKPAFDAAGPIVVEEAESTTVVLPGWMVHMHDSGCLVLKRQQRATDKETGA